MGEAMAQQDGRRPSSFRPHSGRRRLTNLPAGAPFARQAKAAEPPPGA
jgi:hypothetical protein